MSNSNPPAERPLRVELLDSGSGRVIQTWTLAPGRGIRIGRSPENDVVVPDPYVSRHHADLDFIIDRWWITNRGRHGVLFGGVSISEPCPIDAIINFQLGGLGPNLRFEPGSVREAFSDTTMIGAPAAAASRILIDRENIRVEVEEITETPYFRELQQVTRRMRAARA